MKMTKKKLTGILAIVTVIALAVGSFAYFTDRVTADASVTTAKASEIIKVDPDPNNPDPHPDDPQKALEAVWGRNNPDKIVEPGDLVDLTFDLKNIGTSDIDVKETIILTSDVEMNVDDPEWRLFAAYVEDEYGAHDGTTKISVEQISATQIKYTLPAYRLNIGDTARRDFNLIFSKYASNAFQGCVCTVDYLAEMRQHVESIKLEENWDAIRTQTITFAGQTTAVVPKA